jgi:hypothetical protein
MEDEIFIQHRFKTTVEVNGTTFSFADAITLPEDEYDALSTEEIEREKQTRIDTFIDYIKNPPQPDEEEENE